MPAAVSISTRVLPWPSASGAADLIAVDARQVTVEHDDVIVVDGRVRERVGTVEGEVDRHALVPQPVGDRGGQALVIFDDEHAHRHSMPLAVTAG